MTPGPGLQRTTLPLGFLASGVNCGVRRYRPDIGLLISEVPAVAAGVFTLSEGKAAPVLHSQALLPSKNIRAIVTNSGQANAATGPEGVTRNLEMINAVAQAMECSPSEILVASTGVIGVQLATDKIVPAIPELVERANDTAESFALAILTTDLVPKTISTKVKLSKGEVQITGICKGSGMIHPNMATMLGYILTDAEISPDVATDLLKAATDLSFNMISVDGECSTNDCVFLMANGASTVGLNTDDDYAIFKKAMNDIAIFLAKAIAADGEGASKLIEVDLTGAPDKELAKRAARGITLSPLIKTAIHGEDPNWGRIVARLGADRVPSACLEKMSLSIQGVKIFDGGPLDFDRANLRGLLRKNQVFINIDLKSGDSAVTAWGCDLSRKYVDINTEYS